MRRNFFPASEESAGCPAQRLISFSQRSMFRAARGTPTDTVRSGWWWIVSAATPLSRTSDGPSAFLPTLHPGSLFCGCQHNGPNRSEEHTSELQSRLHLVCRLLLEKKKH